MSSVQHLRELMNERLTAAAEEIFRVFHKTIIEYEEEIDRQRRLLDIVRKPEIKLNIAELPQQHVCKEDEVLVDQQLCNQECNSSMDQEDPEPPQIKEEQEEHCTSVEGEQLVLKQETETFMSSANCEENDIIKVETQDFRPDETQSAAETEHVVGMSINSSVDSGSIRNVEPKSQRRHHRSKSDSNSVCNPTVTKIQLDTHTDKKVLKCDTCGKAFKYISELNRHQRIHTGEKPYPCDTCGKRFTEMTKVKRHMRTHTGEKPYPCDTCGKKFSELEILKVHMRVHTGEKPYPCNTCGKRFSEMTKVRRHMRVHTGEKPYPCNTCERRFSYLGALKVHMRVHTGERPYPCKTCEKMFSDVSALKRHMRIHTGEKPYPCNNCGKSFSQRGILKLHMRVHTGEKPYACNTCEKSFTQLGTLKLHMRVHTGENIEN